MSLREYQARALEQVAAAMERVRRVCLVSPTGSGKSVMGVAWVVAQLAMGRRVLFLAHRLELLKQFQGHLKRAGVLSAIIAPGFPPDPWCRVQLASLDTLVARGEVPDADAVLWDECHHSGADTWQPVVMQALPAAYVLGLTATPQRSDGKAIGDVFEELVVAAHYSELLEQGHIVPCRIFRPERYLGSDLAWDPAERYQMHGQNKQGFAFCRSVADSKALAVKLTGMGFPSANIDGKMSDSARGVILDKFKAGAIRMICNVYVLTEGFDVPNAEVCMLARGAGHAGIYLQMVGRVLRPSPGKTEAILIDLPGCSHEHGIPTADREYALSGRAIKTAGELLKVCPECGNTQLAGLRFCEECGHEFPRREYSGPKIWNLELVEYFANVGDLDTAPKSLKQAEWARLLSVGESRGFGISFAVTEYEKIFKARPSEALIKELGDDVKVRELRRLRKAQLERGWKVGAISNFFRQTFGAYPSRALREAAGVPVPSADEWNR